MNREERIKYLQEHQEEIEAQIKQRMEDDKEIDDWFIPLTNQTNALLGKPLITAEEWHRNNILSKVDGENTNDEPIVDGIDLIPYLDMIRYDRIIEHSIILYIKDGKVIETEMIDGNSHTVKIGEEKYVSIMLRARELNAKVYIAHNHPNMFIAKQSTADEKFLEDINACAEKFGVELTEFGVVTIDDYCSYKKSLDK